MNCAECDRVIVVGAGTPERMLCQYCLVIEDDQAKRSESYAEPSESLTIGDVLAQYLEVSQRLDKLEEIVQEIKDNSA
jgi:hypothetical protein